MINRPRKVTKTEEVKWESAKRKMGSNGSVGIEDILEYLPLWLLVRSKKMTRRQFGCGNLLTVGFRKKKIGGECKEFYAPLHVVGTTRSSKNAGVTLLMLIK